tara:strand:+ start:1056 stop:1838 length:783 start_codon:yes stop_codon:yes gene_type:complete
MTNKTFEGDFYKLLNKLKSNEQFAFIRFSDGEMFIMQNKSLVLDNHSARINGQVLGGGFTEEDHKSFDPEQHGFFRDKLMDSYTHQQKNYFKGLSCRCCVGQDNFNYMFNVAQDTTEHMTWANLLVNGNYPKFINEFVPELKDKKCVVICNERADLTNMPFEVVKDFRVGQNCIVNNYDVIEDIRQWINGNEIEDHVFLLAASSLTNMIVHQLFEENDTNTFIDIGTTLNKYFNMRLDRSYLSSFWNNHHSPDLEKMCIW